MAPTEEIAIYLKINRANLGNPVTVRICNREIESFKLNFLDVNLDYLLTVHETSFLRKNLHIKFQKIVEIGGGFGRTAHALLEIIDTIELYVIIDLPEILNISQNYLQQVLSEENFQKIIFLSSENRPNTYEQFDLCIQIDGFQEMTDETVNRYYEDIVSASKYFLSVNPIGKYLPSTAGIEVSHESKIAMKLGRSQDIVDIWDILDMKKNREIHVKNYAPNLSTVVASSPSRIFPHYEMTLYRL
jgi:hypothetical protein